MALSEKEISALRPDALYPAEIEAYTEGAGVKKATTPTPKVIVSSMLAGMFIGFGALMYCLVGADTELSFAASRLLCGIAFTIGLILVLCAGSDLFTGNILLIQAKLSGKLKWGQVIKNWCTVWIGNLLGALFAVLLVYGSHIASMNGGEVAHAMVHVGEVKMTPDWMTIFTKGILCNIFVCLAVWISYGSRTIPGKILGILWPVAAFVACGFEHCVANMFFLPMAVLSNVGPEAVAGVDLNGILFNLSASTPGNIVGGLIVGIAYWFLFHQKKTA